MLLLWEERRRRELSSCCRCFVLDSSEAEVQVDA